MEQQTAKDDANTTLTSSTSTESANTANASTRTSTLSDMSQQHLGLFHMPGEIRTRIYAACQPSVVDIFSSPEQPVPKTALETYYTDTIFLIDAQREEFTCHGRAYIQRFEAWSAQLTDQQTGMLQHLCIQTPAFSSRIHIPPGRDGDIAVAFGDYDSSYYDHEQVMAKPLRNFAKKLEGLNESVKGRRLRKGDIDRLVADVVGAVPFCCLTTRSYGLVCAGAVEEDGGKVVKGCCCCECEREYEKTTETTESDFRCDNTAA